MIAQPAGRHFTRKATAWLAATLLICALCSQATAAPQPADAPPAYAPGTSPTSLGKTLTVRSNHTVASAVLKDAVVQRRVSVTNCSDVRVTQPRHSISMTGDANTHMVLNDTDALDVADDEALDLVATGNAKVVAGEMDGLASVFPDGSITSVAGQAADGSTRSSDAPTPVTPPSRLTNDVDVSASFKVPSRIGSSVRIIDETTLQGASAVHIEGASVDVKSGTSRNAQIVANDADLAGAVRQACVYAHPFRCARPPMRR